MQTNGNGSTSSPAQKCTVGNYLTQRLVQAGVTHCFTVPGDYILLLLDEVVKEDKLRLVHCCNEISAGYAADGCTRATGMMSVVFVTYMVGSLSVINAIAGAYAEDLPLLVVVGAPNNLERQQCHLVHHSIGKRDIYQSSKCFDPVTAGTFVVNYIGEAARTIDKAIKTCLCERKPVYLEIPCNLAQQHTRCWPQPVQLVPEFPDFPVSDEVSLGAAVDSVLLRINNAKNVLVVAGGKLKPLNALDAFASFLKALDCSTVSLPDAKGFINEFDDKYVGCFWGSISSARVNRALEDADLVIYCGAVFSDTTTVGWTANLNAEKSIFISADHVHVVNDRFSFVGLATVLHRLAHSVTKKPANMAPETFKMNSQSGGRHSLIDALNVAFLQEELQLAVGSGKYSSVIAETGESWFIGQKLKLPPDTAYHAQMQYGSIGWGLGCCLGVALLARQMGCGKVLLLVGDGSFQATAQELSTIVAEQLDVTIVLLNNASYGIENQIHPGPYNSLINWKYSKLVDAFNGSEPVARTFACKTNGELRKALCNSHDHYGVALIECCLDPADCTDELRLWGLHIAAANARVVA